MDKIKTFDGLYYDYVKGYSAKYEATAKAKSIRKEGYGARILPLKAKMSGATLYRVYKSRRKLR